MAKILRAAIAQAASVFFDKQKGVDKAVEWIGKAASAGAQIVAFGETWLPGYPFFVDGPVNETWWRAASVYLQNAILVPGPETAQLCAAASQHGIDVVIGVAELDPNTGASIYASLLFISAEGEILGRHRKIKPTHHERSIWADGDVEGLRVHERGYGRLGGLNCWEHNILLPGFALIAQGVQIHVAAWPGREPDHVPDTPVWARQALLSRAFASQAGAFVLAAAGLRRFDDAPAEYRPLAEFEHNGRSLIVNPFGEIIAGPAEGETLLLADLDLDQIYRAKAACDPAGHYSRPDLFELRVGGRALFGKPLLPTMLPTMSSTMSPVVAEAD